MITSIARQSVILKCLRRKSVLVGNYEFYYLAGLLNRLYGAKLSADTKPVELEEQILALLPGFTADGEEEAYLLKMVAVYEPGEAYDDQMRELFAWGAAEPDLWSVATSHNGEEFIG